MQEERTVFSGVPELLQNKTTDAPVVCFYPERFRTAATRFVERFPGEVLYAIKANPDPDVVSWIVEGGIKAFDTASISEIAVARRLLANAHCSYNHPIKPRHSIVTAYRDWGVRDFVVDHLMELEKIFEEIGSEIIVQVRIAVPNTKAKVSFNTKFGAIPEQAVTLLRAVKAKGAIPALSMHIGWQTTEPGAFAEGVKLMAKVAEQAQVRPHYLNVGGGFPSILMPHGLSLENFFETIATAVSDEFGNSVPPLKCEPGSALAHPGGSMLAQVLLVKDESLYLNDGIYGALAELVQSKIQPPTRVFTRDGIERTGPKRQYTVFGPTCDSIDAIPAPFSVPIGTREGDWLELGSMGAYSNILITDFNGLGAHDYAIIGN